ncbi:MAG: DapH/DapD/GlmU-related protein [Acidobacteriota bacterium]|nr:DapH/DapD/GlmU-related protein [Acidobacteriota bacterium]
MTDYFVHPSSVIDEGSVIGEGTQIWHFCHIMSEAQIGSNCKIGQNVFVGTGVIIGNNVKIQNNVSIYTGVVVEDDVFLGPSTVFTNVLNPRSHIERKNEYKDTLVKRGASIGANTTLVCGVTLGQYVFVGAGSVITHNIPDYSLVYGNPATMKGWMCRCGIKLHFEQDENEEKATCNACDCEYLKHEDSVKVLGTSSS